MHPAARPFRRARAGARAGWRAIVCAGSALLAACATPPASVTAPVAPEPPAQVRQTAPPSVHTTDPSAAVDTLPSAAVQQPLDATQLPPFEGEQVTVREPMREIARIDRTVPPDDLWQRIRHGFAMPDIDNDLVRERTAWYAARPEYLKRTLERARRYLYHIVDEIEKRGLPTEIALLPMVESSFNPMAYSRAHASGLWQFIPPTGRRYSLEQNWWYDARRDIVASTSAALDYLADIYELHGDWHLSLASYNWGENAVGRAIEKNRAAGLPTDYSSLSMPAETRHYVPKLQALKNIIANPEPLRINLDPIPNEPYFVALSGTRDLDVQLAAKLAEMPVEEFVALNPGFNRPLMPASVNGRIVLPADKVEVFHANLEKHDGAIPVNWQTYRPQRGESFTAIAKKFRIPELRLREVNGVHRRTRAVPALLVVPVNGAALPAKRMPIMYAPPIPSAGRLHVVRRGDTLWAIARRYDVSVDDLRRWNRVGRLLPGQQLRVSPGGPLPTAADAARAVPKKKNHPQKKRANKK